MNIYPCNKCARNKKTAAANCRKWMDWFAVEWNDVCDPFRKLLFNKNRRIKTAFDK